MGMVFQLIKPNYFFSSSMVIAGNGFMIARVLILVNMLGIIVFALSVLDGNIKGRLHMSYYIMLIYAVVMIIASVVPRQLQVTMHNEKLEMNALIYIITLVLTVFILALFIIREKGGMRTISKLSSLLLLVIIGQFVTNGLFINHGDIISGPVYLLFGVISAMPYIAVFAFENLVLEPTMLKYN